MNKINIFTLIFCSWLSFYSCIIADTTNRTKISDNNSSQGQISASNAETLTTESSNFQVQASAATSSIPIDMSTTLTQNPACEYGTAIIKRISNNTSYPMYIKLMGQDANQDNTDDTKNNAKSNQLLSDNSIIRIKLASMAYADKKPYIAAQTEKDQDTAIVSYPIRANCYDPNDQRCQFKVSNLIDNNGAQWIGLESLALPNKYVSCQASSNDKYIVTSCNENFTSTSATDCHWSIEGNLSKCYLKNASSSGYLGPTLTKNITQSTETQTTKTPCLYGNIVSIQSNYSNKCLAIDQTGRFFLGDSDKYTPAYFILKGEHSDDDRYNCTFGKIIQTGSTVRFEDTNSGKNLNISDDSLSFDNTTPWSADKKTIANKENFEHLALTLNGKDGVGDFSDNWTIAFTNASVKLGVGVPFFLEHLKTETFLCAEMALYTGTNSTQELVAGVKEEAAYANEQKNKETTAALNSAVTNMNEQVAAPVSMADGKTTFVKTTDDPYQKAKIWACNSVKQFMIGEKDLLRTGFANGAPYERIDTNNPEDHNQELSIEFIKEENSNFIAPSKDKWQSLPLNKMTVELSGLLEQDIANFLPGTSLTIEPMLGRGILWFEQGLETSNKFSLTFLAKVSDDSELAIILGDNLSDDYKYKIVLGNASNTATSIFKHNSTPDNLSTDRELINIAASQYNLAKLQPGAILPIWVVFNDGLFLVGQSETLGTNVMLAFQELGFSQQISRVGFSCNKSPILIANVNFGPTLKASPPERIYEKLGQCTVPIDDKLSTRGFRIPNELFICLHAKTLNHEQLILGSADPSIKYKYILSLNFSTGIIQITQDNAKANKLIFETSNQELTKWLNKENSFWLNYNQGLFLVGLGETSGLNPIFVFQAQQPLQNITAFACSANSTIDKFSANSASYFELETFTSKQNDSDSSIGNPLVNLTPYKYDITQTNDWVTIKDLVTNQSYFVTQTPQKGADYSLMLSIEKNGIPKMRWAWQPENEELMKAKMKGKVEDAFGEGLMSASMSMMGVGEVGGILGAAENVAFTAAALAPMLAAAKDTAAASFDYVKASNATATDASQSITKTDSVSTKDSTTSIQNRDEVEKTLEEIKDISPSNRNSFFELLSKCQRVVELTKDPHVLGTTQLKETFFSVIDSLYQYNSELFGENGLAATLSKGNIDDSNQEFMTLLISSAQNNYILDQQNTSDMTRKAKWLSWANLLFRILCAKSPNTAIEIPPLFGEYLWLDGKLPTPGSGKISFQAKGSGEVSIVFAAKTGSYVESQKDLYEVVMINSEETTCIFRLSSLGAPANSCTNSSMALSEVDTKNYWVTLKDGLLNAGITNDDGYESNILSYQDPYPLKNECCIGVGTWNASATVGDLSISAYTPAPCGSNTPGMSADSGTTSDTAGQPTTLE